MRGLIDRSGGSVATNLGAAGFLYWLWLPLVEPTKALNHGVSVKAPRAPREAPVSSSRGIRTGKYSPPPTPRISFAHKADSLGPNNRKAPDHASGWCSDLWSGVEPGREDACDGVME